MTHLRPDLVDLERAEEWESKAFLGQPTIGLNGVTFDERSVMLAINMEDITPPSGSLSDPRLASADKGQRIVDSAVESLTSFVRWFQSIDPAVEP
jgi:creatinine amidohydrolase/Fe(II)-dependent formamide hydrolase-like protein